MSEQDLGTIKQIEEVIRHNAPPRLGNVVLDLGTATRQTDRKEDRVMNICEISKRMDQVYCQERARIITSLSDDKNPDISAPWRAVCEVLVTLPPLTACFVVMLFRDSLIADEGLFAAAAFTDYLIEAIEPETFEGCETGEVKATS